MSKINLTNGGVPATPPSGQTSLFTQSFDKRLYYRLDDGTVIGPLNGGGGSVTDLQTAYDGGNSILIPPSGLAVTITNPNSPAPGLTVTHTFIGGGDAVRVVMGGSSSGTGIVSEHSGAGPCIRATSLGAGNGFFSQVIDSVAMEMEVAGSGASARGLKIDFPSAAPAGVGIEIINLAGSFVGIDIVTGSTGHGIAISRQPTAPTATGDGISVSMNAFANGIGVDSVSAGSGESIRGVASGSGSPARFEGLSAVSNAVWMAQMNAANANPTLEIYHQGTGVALQIDPTTGDAIRVVGATTLFSVDSVGATSTPQVTFLVPGSANTITVVGKSGVVGEPNNPRVRLPGSVDIGAVDRIWHRQYVPNSSPLDLGADATTLAQLPTTYTIQNNLGPGLVVNLPPAASFHNGDEIEVINSSLPGNTIDITSAALTQTIYSDFVGTGTGPFTVNPGLGRRFKAWAPTNGGVGAAWVLLTGVI